MSPAGGGAGIYDKLIPILQQWKAQYNFVGSYYVDIGDNPSGDRIRQQPTGRRACRIIKPIQALGGEIGTHSYTHLINPPTTTFTATTSATRRPARPQITLDQRAILLRHHGGHVAHRYRYRLEHASQRRGRHTQVTAVSGNTITISYVPGGYGP